jgi:hypothetical protein
VRSEHESFGDLLRRQSVGGDLVPAAGRLRGAALVAVAAEQARSVQEGLGGQQRRTDVLEGRRGPLQHRRVASDVRFGMIELGQDERALHSVPQLAGPRRPGVEQTGPSQAVQGVDRGQQAASRYRVGDGLIPQPASGRGVTVHAAEPPAGDQRVLPSKAQTWISKSRSRASATAPDMRIEP